MQKHPHVRGEDLDAAWYSVQTLETPPRAWGRQRPMMLKISVSRNTPTCVGKTEGNYYANDMLEKHPHVRGEDVVVQSDCKATTETPPRAWGRLTHKQMQVIRLKTPPRAWGRHQYIVKELYLNTTYWDY